MTRLLLGLFILSGCLLLNSCSGCSSQAPRSSSTTATPGSVNGRSDGPEGENGANFEEGGNDLGPTDEIETPEERTLDPSTEPDINE